VGTNPTRCYDIVDFAFTQTKQAGDQGPVCAVQDDLTVLQSPHVPGSTPSSIAADR
jgi:hypothetical protein